MPRIDWYERSDDLQSRMIFDSCYGIVRLDRRVPGDGTDWYADVWIDGRPGVPGYENGHFSCEDARIHPADLIERLADDWQGSLTAGLTR